MDFLPCSAPSNDRLELCLHWPARKPVFFASTPISLINWHENVTVDRVFPSFLLNLRSISPVIPQRADSIPRSASPLLGRPPVLSKRRSYFPGRLSQKERKRRSQPKTKTRISSFTFIFKVNSVNAFKELSPSQQKEWWNFIRMPTPVGERDSTQWVVSPPIRICFSLKPYSHWTLYLWNRKRVNRVMTFELGELRHFPTIYISNHRKRSHKNWKQLTKSVPSWLLMPSLRLIGLAYPTYALWRKSVFY